MADLLLRERRGRARYRSLAPDDPRAPAGDAHPASGQARPASATRPPIGEAQLAQAYAAQDALVAELRAHGGETVGFKVGLTVPRMQAFCGVSQPVAGCVLARTVFKSPAEIAVERFVHVGVESELCLLLAEDLPARPQPYARAEVAAALGAAAAAFELVDDRSADYAQLEAFTLVADNAWNAGAVLGAARPAAALPLGALGATLSVNGAIVDRGNSADALGDPLVVLAWLASHLARRGRGLRAGEFVLTGSLVPTRFARAGERYRFELEGLAPVELSVR